MEVIRPPALWPTFRGHVRSVGLTARLGRALGIAFGICFVTGLISRYHYTPWSWVAIPAVPVWGYRLTQGVHVIIGIASIPLLLVKLWSVAPKLFQWPPVRSVAHGVERLSIAVLVSSSLLEVVSGLLNILNWYPWPWSFIDVHHWLAWVIAGSVLLHVAVKLPLIRHGLGEPLAAPAPAAPSDGISRRGVMIATGAGLGVVALTTVGQTLAPLEPIALLAPRRPSRGPQHVPINRTADQAGVRTVALSPDYRLTVLGPNPFDLDLAALDALPYRRTGPADRLRRGLEYRRALGRTALARPRPTGRRKRSGQGRRRLVGAGRRVPGVDDQRPAVARGAARHAPERRATQHRPWLSSTADRTGPSRRVQHEMADPDRGEGMKRVLLGVVGVAMMTYGIWRIFDNTGATQPLHLGEWLVGALILHDGVLSFVVVAIGWLVARAIPGRARAYVQGGLITAGLVTAVAAVEIYRRGKSAPGQSLLGTELPGEPGLAPVADRYRDGCLLRDAGRPGRPIDKQARERAARVRPDLVHVTTGRRRVLGQCGDAHLRPARTRGPRAVPSCVKRTVNTSSRPAFRMRLDEHPAAGHEQPTGPVEQPTRVGADADVAVHDEDRRPSPSTQITSKPRSAARRRGAPESARSPRPCSSDVHTSRRCLCFARRCRPRLAPLRIAQAWLADAPATQLGRDASHLGLS